MVKLKHLFSQVNELIEDSCMCNHRGDVKLSLDRAKEASTKERSLIRCGYSRDSFFTTQGPSKEPDKTVRLMNEQSSQAP